MPTPTSEEYFTFDSNTQTITGYDISGGFHIVIPEQIDETDVLHIGLNAFWGKGLGSVIIPSTILTIGENAFRDNNLHEIIIPESVTEIGRRAFMDNFLRSVVLSDSITELGAVCFANNLLSQVVISKGLSEIDNLTFQNNLLTSVSIPNNIVSINYGAFNGNLLTEIVIPLETTTIAQLAFSNNNIIKATFPADLLINENSFGESELGSYYINSGREAGHYLYDADAEAWGFTPVDMSFTIWESSDYRCWFDGYYRSFKITNGIVTISTDGDMSWDIDDEVNVESSYHDGVLSIRLLINGEIVSDSEMDTEYVESGNEIYFVPDDIDIVIADIDIRRYEEVLFFTLDGTLANNIALDQLWLQSGEGITETIFIWNGYEWIKKLINQDDIDRFGQFLRFDQNVGLQIGKVGDPLSIVIRNNVMEFIDTGGGSMDDYVPDDNVVAYIHGQKMLIDKLEVLSSLIIGRHQIEKYDGDEKTTFIRWVG